MDSISPMGSVRQIPSERMVCRSISCKKLKIAATIDMPCLPFEQQISIEDDILDAIDSMECPSDSSEFSSSEEPLFHSEQNTAADLEPLEPISEHDEQELISLLQEQPIADHRCPHVERLPRKIKKMPKSLDLNCQYTRCDGDTDCSLCLTCGKVFCGEDGDQHMGLHMIKNEKHAICLYLQDFSVYCTRCNVFLDANQYPKIQDVQERLVALKSEESPCYSPCKSSPIERVVYYPMSRNDSLLKFSASNIDSSTLDCRKRKFTDEFAEDILIDLDWCLSQY